MSSEQLWQKVLTYIKPNVTGPAFETFFKPLILHNITEQPPIVYLASDLPLITNVIKIRYFKYIQEGLKNVTGVNYRVVIKNSSEYTENETYSSSFNMPFTSKAFDLNVGLRKEKIFNPKYTFDNFVVGESNKYASAACEAVAKTPFSLYNPLFLYGKSGLGKTHLMNAIGIYMLTHYSNLKILYVSAETFTNDFIKALKDNKTGEFKNKYRRSDILLIDDIQFLEGKEGTQEEFYHTFNTLYETNKQIIISSDRPPIKLTELDERLRSRFEWNMIVDIQVPDFETRVAILQKKAENLHITVDDDIYEIIQLISERIKDNIRELEGAFNRVISLANIMNEKADLVFAKRILKDIMTGEVNITPEKIRSVVANHYKIKVSDLDSQTRRISIAYPRQIAMYLCRTMTDLSLPKIGKLFGDKHYSTVKHAIDKIEGEIKSDAELKEELEDLKEKIEI